MSTYIVLMHLFHVFTDLDPEHVIAVMREFTEDPDKTPFTEKRFLSFKNYLKSKIPSDSLIHLW